MASTGLHEELHSLGISFGPMTKSLTIQKLLREIGERGQTPLGNTRVKKRPFITMYRDNPFLATFRVRRKVMKMWIISCFFKISLFFTKIIPTKYCTAMCHRCCVDAFAIFASFSM